MRTFHVKLRRYWHVAKWAWRKATKPIIDNAPELLWWTAGVSLTVAGFTVAVWLGWVALTVSAGWLAHLIASGRRPR